MNTTTTASYLSRHLSRTITKHLSGPNPGFRPLATRIVFSRRYCCSIGAISSAVTTSFSTSFSTTFSTRRGLCCCHGDRDGRRGMDVPVTKDVGDGETVEGKAVEEGKLRFIDIGINLTDPMFRGEYHEKQRHEDDLKDVISRAKEAGCEKLLVTGSDLAESKKAVEMSKNHPGFIYNTIGVHPCSASQFEKHEGGAEKMLEELKALAIEGKEGGWCVAFGEFGLDYDRLDYCPADVQKTYFKAQLQIAIELSLPLFLHSRAAHDDFRALLAPFLSSLPKRGVVHSFTGTAAELEELLEDGWSIGVNGCSLKTEDNCEVVKKIPLDRLMLETDGPWCDIRPSHFSSQYLKDIPAESQTFPTWKSVKRDKWTKGCMVKSRNEPCTIGHVAFVVAKIRGVEVEELVDAAWQNTVRMFEF